MVVQQTTSQHLWPQIDILINLGPSYIPQPPPLSQWRMPCCAEAIRCVRTNRTQCLSNHGALTEKCDIVQQEIWIKVTILLLLLFSFCAGCVHQLHIMDVVRNCSLAVFNLTSLPPKKPESERTCLFCLPRQTPNRRSSGMTHADLPHECMATHKKLHWQMISVFTWR